MAGVSPYIAADIFTGISLFSAQKIRFLHHKKKGGYYAGFQKDSRSL